MAARDLEQRDACVAPGSRVLVRFDDGETLDVTIRGLNERARMPGTISVLAPLARGILGGRANDRCIYAVEGRTIAVTILRVLPPGV